MDDYAEIDNAQTMWSTPAESQVLLDADCSPTKSCRNMVGVSFDGFADAETDVSEAWRATLERDGKVKKGSGSLRDLIFESSES